MKNPGRLGTPLLLAGLAAAALELGQSHAAVPLPTASPLAKASPPPRVAASPAPQAPRSAQSFARTQRTYRVAPGDTLAGIAEKLLGDRRRWPSIQALNRRAIRDPNHLTPGSLLALPGSAGPAPARDRLATRAAAPQTGTPSLLPPPGARKHRSEDWRNLPRQPWERSAPQFSSNTDRHGIDQSSRVTFGRSKGLDLKAIVSTERIPFVGQITGSRSEGQYPGVGDTIFIRPDREMQVGETYAISEEPVALRPLRSERAGSLYPIRGQVRIVGVRDGQFVGLVTGAHDLIQRGGNLIPNVPRVPELAPQAAPSSLAGTAMIGKGLSGRSSATQHDLVFIDRGFSDGVAPGMVFRAYGHQDPATSKELTSADFIVEADLMVVQVSDRFCTALVINSLVPLQDNAPVTLLTDVSDLSRPKAIQEKSLSAPPEASKPDELDELDELDRLDSEGLGKDEQKELEQLEKWKGNPPSEGGAPATEPSPSPAPQAPEASAEHPADPQGGASPSSETATTDGLAPPETTPAPDTPPPPPPSAESLPSEADAKSLDSVVAE